MSKQVVFYILVTCFFGCKSKAKMSDHKYHNEIFSIYGVQACKEAHTGDAVDSQIGEINCKDITFTYEFGRYGQRPPLSPEESYREFFDNYHYSKFFELTHVDQKVQKIFKDSVVIVKLHRGPKTNFTTMFDCTTCNAIAELKFKGITWYFPSTVNERIFDIEHETTSQSNNYQVIKTYSTNGETLNAGIYHLPYRKQRDFLAIAIKKTSFDVNQQRNILNSIKLQQR